MSFFTLEADVADEIGVGDFSTIWYIVFTKWDHSSISLDFFSGVFKNSIGEEMSKLICVSSFSEVGIRVL